MTDQEQERFVAENEERTKLWLRLLAIKREAKDELARIEKHGGCAGFASRVLAIAEGDDG